VMRKTCLGNILMQDIGEDSVDIANVYEVLTSKEKLLLIMFFQAQLNNSTISAVKDYLYKKHILCNLLRRDT